jgi:two-component system, OmpR family, sensor kinase
MRGPRTLRSRLFSWFFGAIGLAIVTSALVVNTTRPEGTTGVEAAARHMALRLAEDWEDRAVVDGFVDEVRDVTGFEVRLIRDPGRLPAHVRRVAERGGALAPAAADRVVIPIVRGGALVGALEMNRFGVRPAPWSFWRLGLALLAVMAVLSVMASRVANLLARPLEQLARAADRFGGGDLAFRASVGRSRGWVALEVRDVAVRFNRMAERVEAMVRGQRELLGAISHELRSPLGRARVALEIARDRVGLRAAAAPGNDGALEPGPMRALDDVEAQLGAIDEILGDLLDLTRAGLADLRTETRNLGEWLRDRANQEPVPPEVVMSVAPEARHLALPFDAALLGRAVHNLLINARAHGHPPDVALELEVSRRGDMVRVVVRDHGQGFPEGFAERAFEPFVRGDSARSRPTVGAGFGLGLTIVRRIVEAHGGRAFARNVQEGRVDRGPGDEEAAGAHGAEVGFDLPISPPHR